MVFFQRFVYVRAIFRRCTLYQFKGREKCKEWEQRGREVSHADKKVVCLTSTGLSDMHASLCSLNLHCRHRNSVWSEKIPSHV